LVALKCDLRDDPSRKEIISAEQARQVQERIGAVCYRETSAKQHKGIEEIFNLCAQIKLEPESLGIKSASAKSKPTEQPKKNDDKNKKESGGCLMM